MKKFYIIILFLIGGVSLSCNDWLEVGSSSLVVQEDMFDTYEGYHNALNGIYRLLSKPDLYGGELTWRLASVMGHNYQIEKSALDMSYQNAAKGVYDYDGVKSLFESVWKKMYNAIANCNNLIKYTEERESSFFPGGEREKNVILGEAYGLRAFLHLDLLRWFAPAPAADDGKEYIPYVVSYPLRISDPEKVMDVLDKITKDLEFSKECLAFNDTVYNKEAMAAVDYRFFNPVTNGGLFFAYRGCRFNYFAATGMLARAYLYKGDRDNALRCAREVLAYDSWFQFTEIKNYTNFSRKLHEDILMAFDNNKLYDNYETENKDEMFRFKNITELFGNKKQDCRHWLIDTASRAPLKWKPTDPVVRESTIIPIIRKSEIYYILCEILADTDLEEAITWFNKLREARKAGANLPMNTSRTEFLKELNLDATKEFMAEGQTFFFYKRLNISLYDGQNVQDMTGRYVIPIPESETAY